MAGACECGNETSDSIKRGEFSIPCSYAVKSHIEI